jgi:hypothetical protein
MTFKRAMDAMRLKGTRMMRMTDMKRGFTFHVHPGGTVSAEVAQQIIAKPGVVVHSRDVEGRPSAWRMGA